MMAPIISTTRQISSIIVSLVILVVANPPTYFSLLLPNLSVTLAIDIADLDEDIFVKTCDNQCSHETCYTYKEESRSDFGRKEKLLFKIKFEFCLIGSPVVLATCGETIDRGFRPTTHPRIMKVQGRPPNVL